MWGISHWVSNKHKSGDSLRVWPKFLKYVIKKYTLFISHRNLTRFGSSLVARTRGISCLVTGACLLDNVLKTGRKTDIHFVNFG